MTYAVNNTLCSRLRLIPLSIYPVFEFFLFTWGTSGLPLRVLAKTLREQNISNNGCNNIIIQVSSVYSKVNVLGFLHFDGRGEPRIGVKTF